jgi:hypothetical protein
MERAGGRWLRYALLATTLTALVVAGGWIGFDDPARRGVNLAAAIALPLQLVLFALLVVQKTGSIGFLVVWVGSTLLRILAIGAAALLVQARDDLDPMATLLTLAGLLFVLLLLELRELRITKTSLNEDTEGR